MKETQESVVVWAHGAFGVAPSVARIVARANEEAAELLRDITSGKPVEKIGEEIADVLIVLARAADVVGTTLPWPADGHTFSMTLRHPLNRACSAVRNLLDAIECVEPAVQECAIRGAACDLLRLAESLKIDMVEAIDRKMEINRKRIWRRDGTGHGYHVRDKAVAA